ncbi:MAG TPA: hypothetical protein VN842_06310 [Thermoplasmata archaeon]|nr:hypothetical protein [Thermoplasmata archaeon]
MPAEPPDPPTLPAPPVPGQAAPAAQLLTPPNPATTLFPPNVTFVSTERAL